MQPLLTLPSHHGVASLNNKLLIIRSQSDNPSPKPGLFQPDLHEKVACRDERSWATEYIDEFHINSYG